MTEATRKKAPISENDDGLEDEPDGLVELEDNINRPKNEEDEAKEYMHVETVDPNADKIKSEDTNQCVLQPNQERNYDHRLGCIMDNPASNECYNAQFLQSEEDVALTLWEAVEEMQRAGSKTNIFKYVTGFMMT
jgi:hypothetical protein